MTSTPLACPTCDDELVAHGVDTLRCSEDHYYTVVGLSLTTNMAAVQAVWKAIRALEDDAASLKYMASTYGDQFGSTADRRNAEAQDALEAAATLRVHAKRAQERLDALPTTPASLRGPDGQ